MASLLVNLLLALALQASAEPVTGRVSGRVVDIATGEPIVGVRVRLARVAGPTPDAAAQTQPFRPLTNETNTNGAFEITGVPEGSWRVFAQKEGYVPYGDASPVQVSGGSVALPEIRLDRGGVITGRLLDAKGQPLGGINVGTLQVTRMPDGSVRTGSGGTSESNDLGEFRLAGLVPGEHYVIARPRMLPGPFGTPVPAPMMYVPTYYPGFADSAVASAVTVRQGTTTNGIEFSMLTVAAYQVSGVVVNSAGQPVAGALVQLGQRKGAMVGVLQSGPSGPDGSFRIANVPSGVYMAAAAIPVVTRNGNNTSSSVSFGGAAAKAAVEVVVQSADVTGVRAVVVQP